VTLVDSLTKAAMAESPGVAASAEPSTSMSCTTTGPFTFVTRSAMPFGGASFGRAVSDGAHAHVRPPEIATAALTSTLAS
jgi:hypothetical protein